MARKIKVNQLEEIKHGDVVLDEDLIVTSAVGAITSADFDAGKTYKTISHTVTEGGETRNKTVKEALAEIFTKDKEPAVTQPSLALAVTIAIDGGSAANHTSDKYVEVGKSVVLSPTATLNPGSYTYGPATGVTATQITNTLKDTSDGTTKETVNSNTAFASHAMADGEVLRVESSATHTAGAAPLTQLGKASTVAAIAAGTKNATASKLVRAYRPVFYGVLDSGNTTALTSALVRGLAGKSTTPAVGGFPINIKASANSKRMVVAVPADAITSITALLTSTMGLDISGEFVKTAKGVQVEDASGRTPVYYDVWIYCPASMKGDENVDITLNA